MSGDYKSTVFLPRTDFPMKAGLPAREPDLLARWERIGLWKRLRAQSAGREPYILHDGPPYANGNIHIGHALNKILKDVINRTRQMQGFDANYVPGWDCHGLPIEWMVEEKYRARGQDKDQIPVIDFREECRAFAAHWIEVQREEFKRLGVFGDWDNPYTTMAHEAEATIVAELGKYLLGGGLYKGVKPLMWSPVERTVLAEAEVEYEDHTSTTVWVKFPVVKTDVDEIRDASVVIWTTTPWTLPGNRAVAYGADLDYVVIRPKSISRTGPELGAQPGGGRVLLGDLLVVAEELLESFCNECGIIDHDVTARLKGGALTGAVLAHPLRGQGYDFDVPLVEGHHVTTEQGTGFVHIAPGHGADDFVIGQRLGLETPETVGPDGLFYDRVPLFAGTHVFKADAPVAEAIEGAGNLLARGKLTHSYPHSWRSKAPLIFRATPQWFISMETGSLREHALGAIDTTRWIPDQSRNRIRAMVESGPDWCVSRQRAWGVPITVFVHKETGEPLRDAAVMERIVAAIRQEGCDVWFTADPARFLAPEFDAADYEQITDILDVWFDSGATHAFVLEARDDLRAPADLYLEGTDQHRGWFRSSLLESCGTRKRAPYKAVLTHGFVNDEQGRKMSKSLGNTTAPQEVVDKFGADILRLWVVSSDYSEDLRIGPDIIGHSVDTYRRLRNTLRYLLGSLQGFEQTERVAPADMPELERWVLHRLFELDRALAAASIDYDFHRFYTELHKFCALDLSAFYFDVRKDSLYCDPPSAPKRRAARTVLDRIFHCLTAWLAPVLCFTAEEAWLSRFPSDDDSVHLRTFPEIPDAWEDAALARRWGTIRDIRRVVTGALEVERAEKRIGSSLQARPVVHGPVEMLAAFEGIDAAELFITSGAELVPGSAPDGAFALPEHPGIGVTPAPAGGGKCARCWKVLDEVGQAQPDDVCHRCADALRAMAG
ncbi:MAG: isoleucine--tRNA ligase [Alphaproteobacteria bacterium]|nr:isoleucine--tRNA ligase [Alphaproteobacteria bacterium]